MEIATQTGLPGGQIGRAEKKVIPLRFCLYARKSTESEERQILSIDSQIKEMLQLAEREGLEIVSMKRESHSAKETGQRPVFNEIVEEIRGGKYNAILTWAPDRISRNAGDLGRIVDLMDNGALQEIRTYSQTFRNNPNEKFLLMILGSQAKLENDNRGVNVRRGMRTRCEMGYRPGSTLTGYINERRLDRRCQVIVDPLRGPVIRKMYEKVAYEQWSGPKLYHWLRFEINFQTAGNKPLALGNMYRILSNPFYYGVFEYPKKSGNWYLGKHETLVTKEMFDKVQAQLKRGNIQRESHEFAFTKLMLCGKCGSCISAEEKYKERKDGTTARYVYYGCGRTRDRQCKGNTYLREDDLVEQLLKIIDQIDLNQLRVEMKFEDELKRHNKFQRTVLGLSDPSAKHDEVDIKTYAKYILKEGTNQEKRELMGCFRSKLKVMGGVVTVE